MNNCCRCNKRIWPWQKEGNSPVAGTNRRTYFHLTTCTTIWKRICRFSCFLIPAGITLSIVGAVIAIHIIWLLPKG